MRDALHIVRHNSTKDAERQLLTRIAEKKPIIDDWKRQQEQKLNNAADEEYRIANAALLDED